MDFLPIYSFQWTLLENISQFCLARRKNMSKFPSCICNDRTFNFSCRALILSAEDKRFSSLPWYWNLSYVSGQRCLPNRGGQSSRKIYSSRSIVTYSKTPFK